MILLLGISALALVTGLLVPLHWGVAGFVAAAALLFAVQAGITTALGFEGTPLSESLLLFNNDWGAYIGFNVRVTYRAFALPLLALSVPFIYRYGKA
ncbi:hypothetical protein [uncultured Tateyamaria sp.]|uniref:hypothetical protein n=1 Tax=Tateyamaria sp. 1078 TaxID=3417464 RepID=UPI00261C5CE3|nr:hypothetical protein [uncultured Tateyamaria sp.]